MAAIVDLIKLDKLISAGRQRVILPKQLHHQTYLKTHVWRRNKLPCVAARAQPGVRIFQRLLWAFSPSFRTELYMTGECMLTGKDA